MQSMTGYGKAKKEKGGLQLSIELKSVNNRFLDISCRLPRALMPYEDMLRKAISAKVSRGKVEVFCVFTDTRDKDCVVFADAALAKGYVAAADKLSKTVGASVKNDMTIATLMRFPDVITVERAEESEDTLLKTLFSETAACAADALCAMRAEEGKALMRDVADRLGIMEKLTEQVRVRAPFVAAEYREKLTARMTELLKDNIDEGRILSEAALFADKSNIDEELTRLSSHYAQFRAILKQREPAGRKLDFLVQELNREVNTVCSKSSDVEITNCGLLLKSEIEKVREQVQNIE